VTPVRKTIDIIVICYLKLSLYDVEQRPNYLQIQIFHKVVLHT